MKKTLLTVIAVTGLAASSLAQGTITADNLGNAGAWKAAVGGQFYNADGTLYNGASINVSLWGGNGTASSLIGNFTGANAWVNAGPGQFTDISGLSYNVTGVLGGGTATLKVMAWQGGAADYGSALGTDQFWAWSGAANAFVNGTTVEWPNATGGLGSPPSLAVNLVGMPSMALGTTVVPEPSSIVLAGLGAAALLAYRRRK